MDNQNGRRPKWKTSKIEDDQNGRRPKWKMTNMKDEQYGRQPIWKVKNVFLTQQNSGFPLGGVGGLADCIRPVHPVHWS